MAGAFQGISIMSGALSAFQQDLEVTSNNIANVNTTGYSRQIANLEAVPSTTTLGGRTSAVGDGVTVASISRIQDMFLQQRLQTSNSESSRLQTMQDGLNNVQNATLEPGTNGVASSLTAFFNAWSSYGSNPGDASSQQQVVTAATTLTDRVQSLYKNLQDQKNQTSAQITTTVAAVQNDMNQIATLNSEIRQASVGGQLPNDLLDKRDAVVQDLSGLIDLQTNINKDGSMDVSMNGLTLVNRDGARTFPATVNTATSSVSDAFGNNYPIRSGKLAGLIGTTTTISGYQTQLDNFANTMKTQVNYLYGGAKNSAGATGVLFFNDSSPQTGAVDFSVTSALSSDPTQLAGGPSGNLGDGTTANAIAQLSTLPMAAFGWTTPTQYYANFVSSIGSQTSYYQSATSTQNALQTQITNQIQSVSGVSLDSEMSNMLRFQRSYQAAAQALSTMDQTTTELLAMLAR